MAYQPLNLGSVANDGTGDDLRTGGDKINDNFVELYALVVDVAAESLVVDGTSDQIQARVQGHSTQTTNVFVVENYLGTDLFTVDPTGIATFASQLRATQLVINNGQYFGFGVGDVSTRIVGDSATNYLAFRVDGEKARITGTGLGIRTASPSATLHVDGVADQTHCLIQGHSTQTSDILIIEQSDGTDIVNVSNAGRLSIAEGMDHGLVWKDMLGFPIARTLGATDPNFTAFRGGAVDAYAFGAGEEVCFYFHIPHDYSPGTDIYLHVHWGHNGTAISGNMVWTYNATYAKGHDQAAFSAEVTGTITYNTVDITTTPRYQHRIDEIQLSASTPSASQIDTDDIEVDGLLMIQINASTIPTITGGSPNEPFMFMADIHYQADTIGTKNKAPNFYA